MLLTIVTPTYNRAYTLEKLYESLKKQSSFDFEWIIVDDGSTDNTKELCGKFLREKLFSVRYIYKNNGGKHTALNKGIKEALGELLFVVDSDDIIKKDAVKSIIEEWDKVYDQNLCGISFLKGYNEKETIGDKHPEEWMIGNFIDVRFNQNIKGDKAEVWATDKLKEFPFPEFEGEKFIGEGYTWVNLAKKYNMLFVNKILYIADYLEGGLTKSGRSLRIQCPLGGMTNSKQQMSKEFRFKWRFKAAILYTCYGFFAKKSILFMLRDTDYPILILIYIPLGYLLKRYWQKKYLT